MGNVLVQLPGTKNRVQAHGDGGGGRGGVTRRITTSSSSSSTTRSNISSSSSSSTGLPRHHDHHQQQPPTFNPTPSSSSPQQQPNINPSSSSSSSHENQKKKKNKYDYIPDNFSSLHQVTEALRESGLESSNLIIGIDFTKSNEWTGKVSFNNRSLHAIGDEPNPYEKAISIIGKTLAPFDEDNLIPCFGFGDATTHDQEVFSFHPDHSPCHGFEEVLSCYKRIVPNLKLSGPTSFAPVIDAAVSIVEKSGGHFHVLVIIADGQVTRSINTNDMELSAQEEKTIRSIVNASSYPLSIVLVGVGDGPWEEMRKFDDKIPAHVFDNFQFVNFTAIISKNATPSEKETAFALASLMEIPIQYTAAGELGLLGRVTGKAKNIVPRPPPVPYTRQPIFPTREASNLSTPRQDDQSQVCPICLTNGKDMAFGCGHMACRDCGSRLTSCPICRQQISARLRLYTG